MLVFEEREKSRRTRKNLKTGTGNDKKTQPLLPEEKTETNVRLNRQFLTLVEIQFGLWKLYKRAT